jgi:hypothetical protein
MTSGGLTVDQLEDRIRLVLEAKARVELECLVDDVLVPSDDRHPAAGAAAASPGVTRLSVNAGEAGTRRILSILLATRQSG